jgi:cell division protein FtsW
MTPVRDLRPAEPSPLINPASIITVCALGLVAIGITILFSASAWFVERRNGVVTPVPYLYLTKQIAGLLVCAALCWLFARINLDELRRYAWWIGGFALVLLVVVLFSNPINGSRRWLWGVGQPSEFAKFALVFCLAHYLAVTQSRIGEFQRGFLVPILMIASGVGLVLLQTDMGTAALMVAVGLLMLFLAGARWSFIVPSVGAVLAVFAAVLVLIPNRLERFTAFLDVEANKGGKTYQLYQALAAYASGGIEGVNLGQGRQQLHYLPEAHTDFIFSVIGEELGLVGTSLVVVLFATILCAGLVHLRRAPNLFQFLLVLGCLLVICLQAIANLGVVTGLLPTKGMSLPFISAGLSNLLLMGILLGVIWNTQLTWGRVKLPGRGRALREVPA